MGDNEVSALDSLNESFDHCTDGRAVQACCQPRFWIINTHKVCFLVLGDQIVAVIASIGLSIHSSETRDLDQTALNIFQKPMAEVKSDHSVAMLDSVAQLLPELSALGSCQLYALSGIDLKQFAVEITINIARLLDGMGRGDKAASFPIAMTARGNYATII